MSSDHHQPEAQERELRRWAFQDDGLRPKQFLAILGLTGLAVSQPLLSVAGENPSMFTFARLTGADIVWFAMLVAFVPPLVIWAVVAAVGAASARAGDVIFLGASVLLALATAIQLAKTSGIEQRWLVALVGVLGAAGLGVLLGKYAATFVWTRFLWPLPVIAILAMTLFSPSGELVRNRPEAAASNSGGDHPSVVFIMLDELPTVSLLDDSGQIDPVRYPNLADLAATSTWYPHYTAMAPSTLLSVPSILTGTEPRNSTGTWVSQPDNLFSLFAPTHDLVVAEAVTQLCGFSTCGIDGSAAWSGAGMGPALSQIADVWRERVSLSQSEEPDFGQFAESAVPLDPDASVGPTESGNEFFERSRAVARPERVTDFMNAMKPSANPSLNFVHLTLPHQPWTFYPDGRAYAGLNSLQRTGFAQPGDLDLWDIAVMQQAHMFQTQYADRLVGEILDRLRSMDMFDDALVVVTADHGIAFLDDAIERFPNEDALGEVAFVPLLIKLPGQTAPEVDASNLMSSDLLPTIAEAVELDLEWDIDGYPAGSPQIHERGDVKRMVVPEGDWMRGVGSIEEFEGESHRPAVANRLVRPIVEGESQLGGLLAHIDAREHLGTTVQELDPTARSSADLPRKKSLEEPGRGSPLGYVQGEVGEPALGELVLVAIDQTVVTGAPVRPDGSFNTLLPPDALSSTGNEVELFQVGSDGAAVALDLVQEDQ